MILEPAVAADLPAVAALMNRAYRGGGSVEGWCTEVAYVAGARTSAAQLAADVQAQPQAELLVHRDGEAVIANVWLEPCGEHAWYLGSLTVDPALQNVGLGRQLLEAAEAWAIGKGAQVLRMTVVNVRDTLIAWYVRRGYRLTGETQPWPYGDDRFGTPRRPDLAFVVLEKRVASSEPPPPSSTRA